MKKLIPLFLYFSTICASNAQVDSSQIQNYLDDGEVSVTKNILKTDVIAAIQGNLGLSLERIIYRKMTLEGTIGILLDYYVHDFVPLVIAGTPETTPQGMGLSYKIAMRQYFRNAPGLNFLEFSLRRRHYSNMTLGDFGVVAGKQWIVGERGILDTGLGVGIRTQQSDQGAYIFETEYPFSIIVPIHLKFGFLPKQIK